MSGTGKLALDSSVFIYQLNKSSLHWKTTNRIFESIMMGESVGVTSTITVLEIMVRPEKLGKESEIKRHETILRSFPNLTVIPVSFTIAHEAAKIRSEYNIRTPDSIQLATAKVQDADVFVTNDRRLKRFGELNVLTLRDLRL